MLTSSAPRIVTIREALADAAERLAAAGCDAPRLDAEVLLAHALGADRARLVVDAHVSLEGDAGARFDSLLARRAAREPVAYVVGTRGFRWLELRCDDRALIPRPETELLVEVALELPRGARVLDVGTGTGAIALGVASERPDLTVFATEVSTDALALARENAAALGLDVAFSQGDLLAGLPAVDVVLANLPYVPDGTALAPEIALYEPAAALFAGPDGLSVIRRLLTAEVAELAGVRSIALEHGSEQGGSVRDLIAEAGFGAVHTLRDLAGHERVTVGERA